MKRMTVTMAMLTVGVLWTAAGCDVPPPTPRNHDDTVVKEVVITRDAEREVVQSLIDVQVVYRYRLSVLKAYYLKAGALAKKNWAEREWTNLDRAQTFTYVGVTPKPVERGPSLEKVDEATLVEMVVGARSEYTAAVDSLILYYQSTGDRFKESLADNIRRRFNPVRTYMYFLDAEVPPADLRPAEVIPEAETLYAEALRLHKMGKIIIVDHRKQRRSLMKFLELVRRYPSSTRIAYSAYYIGRIYRYFDEDYRSLLWYKRAVQWDPLLDRPARFEAAKVADYDLRNRELAVQLYRESLEHETFNASHAKYANRRISVITRPPSSRP